MARGMSKVLRLSVYMKPLAQYPKCSCGLFEAPGLALARRMQAKSEVRIARTTVPGLGLAALASVASPTPATSALGSGVGRGQGGRRWGLGKGGQLDACSPLSPQSVRLFVVHGAGHVYPPRLSRRGSQVYNPHSLASLKCSVHGVRD